MNNNYALITGASSGIGKFLAFECASRKMNLILVALPETGLNLVADELRMIHQVDVITFELDLTESKSLTKLHDFVTKNSIQLNMLINNAGVGYEGRFDELSLQFCEKMMQLNMNTVVILTHLFLENLKKCEKAQILNVSSLVSYLPIPYKSIYAASKSFVYSFSRSLGLELSGSNVTVSVLCPGPSPSNDVIRERIKSRGLLAKYVSVNPDRIARISIEGTLKGKRVIIPGIISKINLLLMIIFPKALQLSFMNRMLRKYTRKAAQKPAICQNEKAETIAALPESEVVA